MIKAVIFDLDDTLCPEIEYVKSGFREIAKSYNDSTLYEKLYSLFLTDRNNVYQRAGFSEDECKRCIEIYREHKPDITLSEDAEKTLLCLKKQGKKLGLITDGRPHGQWNKIYALGLDKIMDYIVVTDELGGIEFRKPNPRAYELMKEKFGVEYSEMVYVGDNLSKDFTAPKKLGMSYCYYHNTNGLYAVQENEVLDIKKINKLSEVINL
ncbi:MAG: HAD family hydrolase [Ruminococcaceae bacterium]|nr:HAD family hydrolase [Oscillospiraceae bacterium]